MFNYIFLLNETGGVEVLKDVRKSRHSAVSRLLNVEGIVEGRPSCWLLLYLSQERISGIFD